MLKCLRERYALSASERRVELMDIKEIFWDNVFWHIENKGLKAVDVIGKNYNIANRRKLNVTLDSISKIACKLDIDDYAILFEQVGGN